MLVKEIETDGTYEIVEPNGVFWKAEVWVYHGEGQEEKHRYSEVRPHDNNGKCRGKTIPLCMVEHFQAKRIGESQW